MEDFERNQIHNVNKAIVSTNSPEEWSSIINGAMIDEGHTSEFIEALVHLRETVRLGADLRTVAALLMQSQHQPAFIAGELLAQDLETNIEG